MTLQTSYIVYCTYFCTLGGFFSALDLHRHRREQGTMYQDKPLWGLAALIVDIDPLFSFRKDELDQNASTRYRRM